LLKRLVPFHNCAEIAEKIRRDFAEVSDILMVDAIRSLSRRRVEMSVSEQYLPLLNAPEDHVLHNEVFRTRMEAVFDMHKFQQKSTKPSAQDKRRAGDASQRGGAGKRIRGGFPGWRGRGGGRGGGRRGGGRAADNSDSGGNNNNNNGNNNNNNNNSNNNSVASSTSNNNINNNIDGSRGDRSAGRGRGRGFARQ